MKFMRDSCSARVVIYNYCSYHSVSSDGTNRVFSPDDCVGCIVQHCHAANRTGERHWQEASAWIFVCDYTLTEIKNKMITQIRCALTVTLNNKFSASLFLPLLFPANSVWSVLRDG